MAIYGFGCVSFGFGFGFGFGTRLDFGSCFGTGTRTGTGSIGAGCDACCGSELGARLRRGTSLTDRLCPHPGIP